MTAETRTPTTSVAPESDWVPVPAPAAESWAYRAVHRLASPSPAMVVAYLALAACFMMFFLQTDILYNSFISNEVARGHLDVYSYLAGLRPRYKIDTVMPPLYYLATGLYLKLLMLIHLDPVATNPANMFRNVFHTHMGIVLMLGLLLLKLPNFAAALAGLWGISWLADRTPGLDRRLVSFLWISSPALIVSALMQAQNDVIATAITIFALLAWQSKRNLWMFVLLGLAACFKTYALILIPPAALLLCRRDIRGAVGFGALGALPLALVSLPFLGGQYVRRVFEAHDGTSLLGASYVGRLPVHLWVLGYLVVLGLAWIMSNRDVDLYDLALIFFLPLCLVFVVGFWVPQWTVWLLPSVALIAARDRVFAWLWVFAMMAVFVDNILNYPGNMDGGMLEPFYGDRRHPPNSHFYNFHLFHIWKHVPYALRDGVYIVCGALFLALLIRAFQWLLARSQAFSSERTLPAIPGIYSAGLAGTLLLVPYIATMVAQRLAG